MHSSKRRPLRRLALLTALLALLAAALPAGAGAASVRFPINVGFLYVGDSMPLMPALSGVSMRELNWASTDSSVVRMDGNRLAAVGEGIALIGAMGRGAWDVCGAVVLPREIALTAGERHALPANGLLEYATADARVATVDASGTLTAVAAGETLVGVRFGKAYGIARVTVSGGASPTFPPAQERPEGSAAAELDCAGEASQIVLVDYEGGSRATVSFHEKVDGVWTQLYETYGYVGRNGVGKTREGDGRTPSGTYNLSAAFGIEPDPGAAMPYLQVTESHYWCGTSGSEYYNQLVDAREAGRAPQSGDEVLVEYGGYYDYCLFIDYNAAGEPGKGSCIFLHCIGGGSSTSGCIAIPEDAMRQAVRWARPGAKIVIR